MPSGAAAAAGGRPRRTAPLSPSPLIKRGVRTAQRGPPRVTTRGPRPSPRAAPRERPPRPRLRTPCICIIEMHGFWPAGRAERAARAPQSLLVYPAGPARHHAPPRPSGGTPRAAQAGAPEPRTARPETLTMGRDMSTGKRETESIRGAERVSEREREGLERKEEKGQFRNVQGRGRQAASLTDG